MFLLGVEVPEELVQAVEQRLVITFCYTKDPHHAGERVAHPHVLYESSPGKVCLHGVQVDGPTSGGKMLPAWRSFDVEYIKHIRMTGEEFACDSGLNLGNAKIYRAIFVDCVRGRHG